MILKLLKEEYLLEHTIMGKQVLNRVMQCLNDIPKCNDENLIGPELCYTSAIKKAIELNKNYKDCTIILGAYDDEAPTLGLIGHCWVEDETGNIYETNRKPNTKLYETDRIEISKELNEKDVKELILNKFKSYKYN